MDDVYFLDIEASGLHFDSYPIEIAWSYPDGRVENHLINPSLIEEWQYWDDQAEEIHGISREHLHEYGESPFDVANRIAAELDGKTLLTDNPQYDWDWIYTLFKAVKREIPIYVSDAMQLFMNNLDLEPGIAEVMLNMPANEERKKQLIREILAFEREKIGIKHRADADVRMLMNAWKAIQAR